MVDTFLISYDYTPLDIYFFAFGQIYSKLVYLPQNLVIYEQKKCKYWDWEGASDFVDNYRGVQLISFALSEILAVRLLLFLSHVV